MTMVLSVLDRTFLQSSLVVFTGVKPQVWCRRHTRIVCIVSRRDYACNDETIAFLASTTGVFQQRLLHTSVPARDAPKVPDFTPYEAKDPSTNRALSYFMIGSLGVLSASAAKSTVTEFLASMSASADVLALAKVEVELASIPEGKNVIIKWRGKPVFIRHRTSEEIEEAKQTDWKTLRDPESDEQRTKKPEWLVMLGVCTHLGCVPIGEAGDYGGWFCPCHGSHYDISGRIRKGPAPVCFYPDLLRRVSLTIPFSLTLRFLNTTSPKQMPSSSLVDYVFWTIYLCTSELRSLPSSLSIFGRIMRYNLRMR
ncbi:unnamed protein product [Somion occarium]|uniref:Rieske domain-containing protein n=1 Tax=Somion occarium TaxID=3059160 RepID=A0ABP1CKK0_9APHY